MLGIASVNLPASYNVVYISVTIFVTYYVCVHAHKITQLHALAMFMKAGFDRRLPRFIPPRLGSPGNNKFRVTLAHRSNILKANLLPLHQKDPLVQLHPLQHEGRGHLRPPHPEQETRAKWFGLHRWVLLCTTIAAGVSEWMQLRKWLHSVTNNPWRAYRGRLLLHNICFTAHTPCVYRA